MHLREDGIPWRASICSIVSSATTIRAFATDADVRAFEQVPYADRIAAQSTYDAIKLGAARNPDAPAIQFLPNADPADTPLVITYRDFVARVTQAANMFHALGVGKDDVVSFLLPLLPDAFVTLFGAEAAGIANPVNPLLEPHQIAEILEAANTKVLVALGPMPGTDIWQKVEQVRGKLKHLKAIVQVARRRRSGQRHPFLQRADQAAAVRPAGQRPARFPAATSRPISTPAAPPARRSSCATPTPTRSIRPGRCNLLLKSKPGSNLLFGMPLFHVGGSLTQALTHTRRPAAAWSCCRRPAGAIRHAVKNIWGLVERFKPEALSSVPTVLAATLAIPPGNADISSLRYAAGGGSAIPVAVGQAIQDKLKLPVLEVYGMTETSSVHTMAYPDRPIRLGSVGLPVPYSRVRIVKLDADGNARARLRAGRDRRRASWPGPACSAAISTTRTTRARSSTGTGSIPAISAGSTPDGYLWITGRAKDLVIRGGHNIDPAPIEEIMFQHPAVGFAAVVGQPDRLCRRVAGGLCAVEAGRERRSPANWKPGCASARRSAPPCPVQIIPIDPMPLTGVGKVFKPQLRWDAAQTRVHQRAGAAPRTRHRLQGRGRRRMAAMAASRP